MSDKNCRMAFGWTFSLAVDNVLNLVEVHELLLECNG